MSDAYNSIQRRDYPNRRLGAASLPTSERVLYECPPGMTATIDSIHVCSTHTGSETFRMWHVRQNEATSLENALFYDYSISAKAYLQEDGVLHMTPGERIVASAANSGRLTMTLYGTER
jgi:hypothetical protein